MKLFYIKEKQLKNPFHIVLISEIKDLQIFLTFNDFKIMILFYIVFNCCVVSIIFALMVFKIHLRDILYFYL